VNLRSGLEGQTPALYWVVVALAFATVFLVRMSVTRKEKVATQEKAKERGSATFAAVVAFSQVILGKTPVAMRTRKAHVLASERPPNSTAPRREHMESRTITVIVGGTGKTGRRVQARLNALGVPVRTVSRSSEASFDWEQERTWAPALRGAKVMYLTYYPDLAFPGAAERIRKLSKLAVESGIEHIVLLSGRGEHQVWPSERAVRESGASFTVLRCAWFAQNFSEGQLLGPVLGGEVALPAADVREPFIDADDIADVAVAALTDARHAGQIYDLTGPSLLSFSEALREIASVTGRSARYTPISNEAFARALAPVLPPTEAAFLTELFSSLLDGHNSLLTDGVQRVLGREPREFSAYVRDAARGGAWSA